MTVRNENLRLRATIIQAIRDFFVSRGFLEVETPLRIPANAPEVYIEPCRSGEWYLHTSPELCMKRLLCRGHEKIFQICRCWREGERGRRHIPEFTMLEWYRANNDYYSLMKDCDDLLNGIDSVCRAKHEEIYRGQNVNLAHPAEKFTVKDAFSRFASIDLATAIKNGSFEEVLIAEIEPALPHNIPVILMEYPAEMAALARLKNEDASVAERFELYAGNLELANGFSELNDPQEQRLRFLEANNRRRLNGVAPLPLPESFLDELSSMPPSAGIALGIDRLVMLCAGAEKIDDVVTFTPEEL